MLSSKVALITGAAQGIGLATTRLLLRNGVKVSMLDVCEKIGQSACRELQKDFSPEDVTFIVADVTNSKQLRDAFTYTKEKFGGLDIVCNNAGIGDESQWRKMIDINLTAVIEGTFLALDHMSTQRGGRGGTVINIASMGGIVPMPFGPTYCASKHGVVGFSRSMKACLEADGVRVNCLCPEFVDTPMVQSGVLGLDNNTQALIEGVGLLSPDKVAEGILELITDTSRVGEVLTVTLRRGLTYFRFPGDGSKAKAKSKL